MLFLFLATFTRGIVESFSLVLLYKKGLYTEEERSIMNMANINGASIIKYVVAKAQNDQHKKVLERIGIPFYFSENGAVIQLIHLIRRNFP